MSPKNERIRELMLYEFKQGRNAAASSRKICDVEGPGTVSERTCQNWFKKFKQGDMGLKHRSRSGRPTSINLDSLRLAIEAEPAASTLALSAENQCTRWTIVRGLNRLGKVYKRPRQVPYDLTPAQEQRRVEVCKQLLANPKDERFFKRVLTCDEKWILFFNPSKKNQWLDPGQLAVPTPRKDLHQKKVMLCVWWNSSGIVHFELLDQGLTINAALYTNMLDRVQDALVKQYPAVVNRSQVLFLQDNARPHTARLSQQKMKQLGWEVLPHPAYSPDLAPSDYYLFRSLERFLRGRQFTEVAHVEAAFREYYKSKDLAFYKRGIESLAERWQKTIDHNGSYFK